MDPDYVSRLAGINHALGIPADYGPGRGLALQSEAAAAGLIRVAVNAEGREVRLTPPAAAAWTRMQAAAAAEGIVLLPLSGFRSVARQSEIIREKLAAGEALANILRLVAAPGYSEHHTGRALDIGAPDEPPLEEGFAQTAAFRWLRLQAGKFGFRLSYPRDNPHGIAYEPWHWCWRD